MFSLGIDLKIVIQDIQLDETEGFDYFLSFKQIFEIQSRWSTLTNISLSLDYSKNTKL